MTVTSAPAFNAVARMASIRARFDEMAATVAQAAPPVRPAGALDAASILGSVGGTGQADFSTILQAATVATAGTGSTTPGSPAPQEIIDVATEYLGIPYVWGGTNPSTGLDCSGFVQKVFERFGIDLPRVSRQQALAGEAVPSIEDARPGDLIAFGHPVDHIGIYVGDNKFIHAPKTGDVVKISPIYRTPTAIRRVVPSAAPGVAYNGGSIGGLAPTGSSGVGSGVARYSELFNQAGSKWGVSPRLLAAVAQAESGGNPNAVSRSGALGLMQFMPSTANSFGIDPLDPKQAVDGAARYLSQQITAFGSIELALASYNAGPGAVRKYGGVPPFPETQAYVRKIMTSIGGTP